MTVPGVNERDSPREPFGAARNKGELMNDIKSLCHSVWDCKYHVVSTPKCIGTGGMFAGSISGLGDTPCPPWDATRGSFATSSGARKRKIVESINLASNLSRPRPPVGGP